MGAGEHRDELVLGDVHAGRPEFVHHAQHVGAGGEEQGSGVFVLQERLGELLVVIGQRQIAVVHDRGQVEHLHPGAFALATERVGEFTRLVQVLVVREDRHFLRAAVEEMPCGDACDLGAVETDQVELAVPVVAGEERIHGGDALETVVQFFADARIVGLAADDHAVAVVGVQAVRDRAVLAHHAQLHGEVELLEFLEDRGDEAGDRAPAEEMLDGGERAHHDHHAEIPDADAVGRAGALTARALTIADFLHDLFDACGRGGLDE